MFVAATHLMQCKAIGDTGANGHSCILTKLFAQAGGWQGLAEEPSFADPSSRALNSLSCLSMFGLGFLAL